MMSKNFKDWMKSEELNDDDYQQESYSSEFKKKDSKRYDRKKSRIQSARRNKNKNKFSHLE